MRRSMVSMLVLAGVLSTRLAAQSEGTSAAAGAWTLGLAATLGAGWQIEGADLGVVRGVRAGPFRYVSLVARLGSFVDQAAVFGGSRGFVAGASVGGRTGLARLAEFGTETSSNPIGVDLTVEAVGYLASNSPLPQGSPWAALSILPGVRLGDADGARYGLLLGPTVFFGPTTDVRAFLGVRFEAPLARRERHP